MTSSYFEAQSRAVVDTYIRADWSSFVINLLRDREHHVDSLPSLLTFLISRQHTSVAEILYRITSIPFDAPQEMFFVRQQGSTYILLDHAYVYIVGEMIARVKRFLSKTCIFSQNTKVMKGDTPCILEGVKLLFLSNA